MRKRKIHHDWLKERQQTRKLRKSDKRAAEIMIAVHGYKPKDFADGCDGRWSYWNRDYWGEWDEQPAHDVWRDWRFDDHPNATAWYGYREENGECVLIPKNQRPRGLRLHERRKWYVLNAPTGWRWRGSKLVPVDQFGAMVRIEAAKSRKGEP